MKAFVFLLVLASLVAAETKCAMEQSWPPPPGRALPWYTIDLDAPPEERWYEAVKPRATQIKAMITEVLRTITLGNPTLGTILRDFVDLGADNVLSRFPPEYAAEIRGIYAATGIDVGLLCVYQIFYEVEGLCTSIVTQTPNGDIRHSRNLDFGLFLGWDKANETWALTELLRPLLFNAKFMKNGQNLYNATYYAGYIGLLTGAKKGGFSITVDSRYDTNLDKYLFEWLTGKWKALELGILTRTVMENNNTYDDALKSLSSIPIAGPAYIILGGAKTDEGAIITRNASGAIDVWTLAQQKAAGKYYVLETNYDHWKPAPFFDNRRTPAEKCLEIVGAENFSKETLYNVLTGKPNRNMLTTYTSLMHVPSGDFEAYFQYCPPPCDPW